MPKSPSSDATRGESLRKLFDSATLLPKADREAFVRAETGGDTGLMFEVLALLDADEAALLNPGWNRSALAFEAESLRQAPDPSIGDVVGSYRLVELIGQGGMGKVYRAVRVGDDFDKVVALKQIRMALDPDRVAARFRAERQILANLEHPNIARLLDGGADSTGAPYLVMEFVDGVSPTVHCETRKLDIRQRLEMFRQICSAVHYAHQRMVVHRDLKPGNILVTSDGVPKLLDFGIAKVVTPDPKTTAEGNTETGMQRMTARYSSPEQVRGESVTTASDIYSLGVILYELLTGHSPYRDLERPSYEVLRSVCEDEPVLPSTWSRELRGDLDQIILKALRKNAGERYASVDQFSEDVQRYLDGRAVEACGDALPYVAAKFIRRNRTITIAAVVTVCALAGGLIAVNRARGRADRRFNEVRRQAHSMIFDYHDAIQRLPGSTPIRARMVKDALEYLDSLSKDADTPELRREIIEAYVRMSAARGDSYQTNLGDTAGAMEAARKAVDASEVLLKEDRSPETLMTAASAFAEQGSLFYGGGDLNGADRQYRRAIELRETAAEARPDDIENGIALSTTIRQLGDLSGGYGSQNLGKTDEAAKLNQRAADLLAKLSSKFPGNMSLVREHYEALISLNTSEAGLGHRQQAVRYLEDALQEITKVTAADPNDAPARGEQANVEVRVGQALLDDRKFPEALPHIARSAALLEGLSKADPGNALFRRNLSLVENQWAAGLRSAGDAQAALPHNIHAVQLSEALSREAPASLEYRSDLGLNQRKLAETMIAAGDGRGALERALIAREILCGASRESNDAYLAANCGRALAVAGHAEMKLERPVQAVEYYREAEAVAIKRTQADGANAIYRSDLARAQSALGAGLAKLNHFDESKATYGRALENFDVLRKAQSLSAEDSRRADIAAQGLAAIAHR